MSTQHSPTVLIVEDEPQMRRLLRVCLERNSYTVVEAPTGDAAIDEALRSRPSVVVLDLGLPDMDGVEVLKRLREWSQVPILVLSVRDRDNDKVGALDAGANDYITKPFSTSELLARLRVALRLAQPAAPPEVFRSGPLKVDLRSRSVEVNSRTVKLSVTEYSLLRLLVTHAGKVLTHGQILREIWGTEDMEKMGDLRVYVTYLRKKIESDPAEPELLVTEPGVGYRLAALD